ncbi:unnamed protein product [Vicia faba]|uniref:Uncharacterized protein n=1 Tax=Vicia faba TaxID=3906 RepID=A0AAV1AHC9_VICFA|nr:unnamed protein product [Vicia faba]
MLDTIQLVFYRKQLQMLGIVTYVEPNLEEGDLRQLLIYYPELVAPQVNQLVQVAQKCQSTISESGSDGVSQHDLQSNNNMVLIVGRQLVKSLELQSLNDLGFSKRFVRTLQISEVCNNMKDLIDISSDQDI